MNEILWIKFEYLLERIEWCSALMNEVEMIDSELHR